MLLSDCVRFWPESVFFLQEPVELDVRYEIRRIPGSVRRTIRRLALEHRGALLREWELSQTDE